ncbi:hypothetical protein CEY15_05635 [Dietzia natronolimnaea]|uniref:Uncharacterized protein n=1 Tax=Dietzia natronolimnaea TaxID=161920 RepID=A0A2A2WS44_9ACTN|nr:hypothetical protein CEY15_05635 [Dietzia natronolimnaea]
MVGFGGGARGPVVTMRRLLGTVAGVAGMGLVGASATRAQVGPGSLGPSPLLFHSPVLEPYVDELPRPDVLPGESLELSARTGTPPVPPRPPRDDDLGLRRGQLPGSGDRTPECGRR